MLGGVKFAINVIYKYMKMWRVIVRMSFNRDKVSPLRNKLEKIFQECGIRYARNTGTWEGPLVRAAAAATQLEKTFSCLSQHYRELDQTKNPGPKIEHLWLYID